MSRGVRQGDSLSPMLYIFCVETLACQICSCSQIEGFLLPGANGSQYKVGIYADDTTSLVKSVYSLAALFRVINVANSVEKNGLRDQRLSPDQDLLKYQIRNHVGISGLQYHLSYCCQRQQNMNYYS